MGLGLGWVAACAGGPSGDAHLDVVFDVCQPVSVVAPTADAAQAAAIEQGLALWRPRGVASLNLVTAAPALEIRFAEAAAIFHGVYEDELGVIFLNRTLSGDDLSITLAHELGHAFGLWHVDDRVSVMNPGNLSVPPNDADADALTALWGGCAD